MVKVDPQCFGSYGLVDLRFMLLIRFSDSLDLPSVDVFPLSPAMCLASEACGR